ncbi:hypothetical protein BLGI_4682 [Brevibacillus laterosporus GI-9]|uniref:hypothetical protein n=1 Tax=Brevibacillus laterosporus TaxID=1465 RepID=UPI0002405468|nr:hypothetical protein [Brevibacillus laterosporus]CCF16713.1 hypothetical protein BLGI_4682 [Brevibacillus laterosporus GI-9]
MKKKMIGALALTCVLSGVSVMPTFVEANQVEENRTVANKSYANPTLIQPMKSKKILTKNLANTDMAEEFSVNKGYGWVKVYVYNSGPKTINISVTDDNGKEKMSGKVAPGKPWTGYSEKPWGIGDYTVGLTSGQAEMSGKLAVRIAQNRDELDD